MNFFELIKARHSVRSFKPDKLDKTQIETLLEASNQAPSAGNLQAYEIDVILDPAVKEAVMKCALNQKFIAEAPVVFVFFSVPVYSAGKYGMRGHYYAMQDTAIAAAYTQLAATEMGLASCWVGAFVDASVNQVLNAPNTWHAECIMPIGYSNEDGFSPPRRALRYNKFPA